MQNDVPLLKAENVRVVFGEGKEKFTAVDGVSFDIKKGEVFGLVGESGSGKTTLGRAIMKIYDISSGSVYFKGELISRGLDFKKRRLNPKKEEKRKREVLSDVISFAGYQSKPPDEWNSKKLSRVVQMIFQDPTASLDPRMTVEEIVSEGLVIKGERDREKIREKVIRTLERVGLGREHAVRYPHEFSGGQKQRIGIARAVIMEPELIIADEPVSALDVSVRAQVINLLSSLRKDLGLTVLFIAHDLSVVKYFSDRIAVMYLGKIVELASSSELFAHPLHPYTQALISAIPRADPVYEKHRKRIVYESHAIREIKEDFEMREVYPGHFVYCSNEELPIFVLRRNSNEG